MTYYDGVTQKTVSASAVYDALGRVIQKVDANGGQVNTSYDAMGRVISVTNPFAVGGSPGPVTSYAYDALGRVSVTTSPDTQIIQISYNGPLGTVTDQVNRKTQRVSDGLGRVVTVNEQDSSGALTQATSYTYDYLNSLTQVNQGGQYRKYKYDAVSRLLFERIPEQTPTIPDGGVPNQWTAAYTYTTFNAINTKQDARGVITTYTYDSLRRVTQTSYNTVSGVTTAPTVTYTFDSDTTYGTTAAGKLVRLNVGSDYQERYTFDADFRVSSTIRTIGTRNYTTGYGYNEASQLTQLTYPSTRVINVNHDASGRLSGLADGGNGSNYLSNVGYNVAGQVTGDTLGNGVTEVFGYDASRMQLISQKAGTASPYTNRMNLTYSYQATAGQMGVGTTAGNTGQLISLSGTINGTTESAAYTYDDSRRLVTSSQTSNGSSAQRRFAHDRWGNRTGVWDATSGGNQIQSISLQQSGGAPTNQIQSVTAGGTVNYSYDAAGNVTNDGVHVYTYDSENRLVSVDGGSTASYAYDNQNRRYKKTAASTITHYIWEGSQAIAEHNGATGVVLSDYIFSGGRMITKVATGQYFLSDRLSLRLTMDVNGNVTGRQAHLPFGEDFGESGAQDKHHFASYERDSENGSDYGINRQYSLNSGRFMRPDPVAGSKDNPQSLNRYSYVQDDPVNAVDPLGLEPGGLCYSQEVIPIEQDGRLIRYLVVITARTCESAGGSTGGTGEQRGGGSGDACDNAKSRLSPADKKASEAFRKFSEFLIGRAGILGSTVGGGVADRLIDFAKRMDLAIWSHRPPDLAAFRDLGSNLGQAFIDAGAKYIDVVHYESYFDSLVSAANRRAEAWENIVAKCGDDGITDPGPRDFPKEEAARERQAAEIIRSFVAGLSDRIGSIPLPAP